MSAAATAVAVKDFVTVVSVDGSCDGGGGAGSVQQHQQQQHHPQRPSEDSFVTVLAIGQDSAPPADDAAAQEVLVYRLPGERLGFGLRFDGVDTSCNRLFVQSCADGSPASRTLAPWGPLSAGDEIVRINGLPVNRLSRDDCVRCLKESGLVVKLHMVDGRLTVKAPPPVPPRKQRRPEPPILGPPIAASDVYTDAVERFVYHGESESDDTNSSVSTVVSKCPAGTPYAGDDTCSRGGADAAGSNGQNDDAVLDRVLEPFMQLEREFSSSAAVGDDVGLYEKLIAVAEEDRGLQLPPKPLPRKEARPPKKKPPPPPPPLPPSTVLKAQQPPPPPPYRLPPRLVDFVHKDDAARTAADDGGGDDNVFANDDSISGPSANDCVIAEQDDSPEKEDGQESKATSNQPADLTAQESITPENNNSCVGNRGGERSSVMKSSYPAPECVGADTETDSDGSRNAAATTKRPSPSGGRTDEVCNRSVRDKIAMFSRATTAAAEKKDSVPSSSANSTATGPPDSSPGAAAYRSGGGPLPRNVPAPSSPTPPPPPPYQQQWPQRGPGAAASGRPITESHAPATDLRRRSLSLVEQQQQQQPYSKYFNSMNAYAEMGRSSLNALIEQRRRSMSKLRGLVIPEKAPLGGDARRADDDAAAPAAAIPDLPLVIKATAADDDDEAVATAAVLCPPTKTYVNGPPPVTGTATRRANPVMTAVARQMTFVSSTAAQPEQRRPSPAARAQQQPEQRRPSSASSSPSSPSSSSPASSSSSSLNSSREELRLHIHDHERTPSPAESKSSFKADSDEDSALSSSRSSTSLQQYSPASSPPPPPPTTRPPPPVNVAVEVGKRVLKAESVEAINRKNVLCSARTSSGKPEPLLFGGNSVAQKTEQQQQPQHSTDGPAPKAAKTAPSFVVGTAGGAGNRYSHIRMSSVDSTTSDDSSMQYAVNAEPFGSISSIASSTSLISQQELQQLIDDANLSLEENGCGVGAGLVSASSVHVPVEVMVVILHRDMATSSAGITLAGGADYETKEITVYKVLTGSPADKDGRIRKGDRILSINGKSMKGITHRESLAILKAPRSEVVLVISRCKSDVTVESTGPVQSRDPVNSAENDTIANRVFGHITKVKLSKDGSGLGFSLEGGKNSPIGDQPLTVKKIFTGGCAEQCGQMLAGDELVSVNDIDVTGMSRTEAWNLMKRLVNGTVTLGIRHRV